MPSEQTERQFCRRKWNQSGGADMPSVDALLVGDGSGRSDMVVCISVPTSVRFAVPCLAKNVLENLTCR